MPGPVVSLLESVCLTVRVPGFDEGATLAERMRTHAADHQHLYGHLMRAMADDWEAGGPVRLICAGWERSSPGAVVQLRLLAGLFRIVLTGRAPQLEQFYPCLGGKAPPDRAWPLVREVLAAHVAELQTALLVAPQTNEVGRANALLVGLFHVVRETGTSKVRLLEPGASAGLNLLLDRFRFVNPDWAYGPPDSVLVLRNGVVGEAHPVPFLIVARRGCDLSPVDPTSIEGRLRLTSFVWPFQQGRHDRLRAALEIATTDPAPVDQSAAGEWLEEQLADPVPADVVTVVWQSITRMYWPEAETARVANAIAGARRRGLVAHVAMEYADDGTGDGAWLTVDDASLAKVERQGGPVHLARVGDHGVPVTLL